MNEDDLLQELVFSLYESINNAFCAGAFAEVDAKIRMLDVDALPVVLLLAWLSSTHVASDKLLSRAALCAEAQRRLSRERGEDEARELLRGLLP